MCLGIYLCMHVCIYLLMYLFICLCMYIFIFYIFSWIRVRGYPLRDIWSLGELGYGSGPGGFFRRRRRRRRRRRPGWVDGWMMDGWMMDGRMDGWMMDGCMMDGWQILQKKNFWKKEPHAKISIF